MSETRVNRTTRLYTSLSDGLTEEADYIGGHIKGTINVPSLSFSAPQLVERLRDKETVVFHCALSQQRGPGAALRYLREKERQEAEQAAKAEKEEKRESKEESEAGSDGSRQAVPQKKQRVLVLDQGFVAWQRAYGEDERLTEGYSRALWADYMD